MAAEALALIRMRRRRLENETGTDERFDWNVGVGPTDESGKSSSSLHEILVQTCENNGHLMAIDDTSWELKIEMKALALSSVAG